MAKARKPIKKRPAAKGAIDGAGKGGVVPPASGRLKPGHDPRRAKGETAGAIIKNHINRLIRRKCRQKTLRVIVNDSQRPESMRLAAQVILHARRATTIADFEPWLKGKKSLRQLSLAGVDVSMVKSATINALGHRRIQLHEDMGQNFDRIVEQTDGRPKQTAQIEHDVVLRTPTDRNMAAVEAAARLRQILSPSGN